MILWENKMNHEAHDEKREITKKDIGMLCGRNLSLPGCHWADIGSCHCDFMLLSSCSSCFFLRVLRGYSFVIFVVCLYFIDA